MSSRSSNAGFRVLTRNPAGKTPTRDAIRTFLRSLAQSDPDGDGGARSTADIAAHVGITYPGARQHLDLLEDLGEVAKTAPVSGRGRTHCWKAV